MTEEQKHTGQGQIIKADTITQDENGNWIPATQEPYNPSFIERVLHFLGRHQWTWLIEANDKNEIIITNEVPSGAKCLMCGKIK